MCITTHNPKANLFEVLHALGFVPPIYVKMQKPVGGPRTLEAHISCQIRTESYVTNHQKEKKK